MNFSQKLSGFQKNGRKIRNQWRQIYSSKRIHRECNNFLQGEMVPSIQAENTLEVFRYIPMISAPQHCLRYHCHAEHHSHSEVCIKQGHLQYWTAGAGRTLLI